MLCYEVTVRTDIIRWVRADTPEKAGRRAAELVQNENWVRPGSVAVVGVVESVASDLFLEHHAVTVDTVE